MSFDMLRTPRRRNWSRIGSMTLAALIASAGLAGAIRIVSAQDKPAVKVNKSLSSDPYIAYVEQDGDAKKEDSGLRAELNKLLSQRAELDARINGLRARMGGNAYTLRTRRSEQRKLNPDEEKKVAEALKQAEEAMKQAHKALEEAQKLVPGDFPMAFRFISPRVRVAPPRINMRELPLLKSPDGRFFHFDSNGDAKDWEAWSKKYQEEWKKFQPQWEKQMREFHKRMEEWQRDFEKRMQGRERERSKNKPENRDKKETKAEAEVEEIEVDAVEAPVIIEPRDSDGGSETEETSNEDAI